MNFLDPLGVLMAKEGVFLGLSPIVMERLLVQSVTELTACITSAGEQVFDYYLD